MNHLHPLAWLGIGGSLGLLGLGSSNWLIGLMALTGAMLVSQARRGPRTGAFWWAMAAGALGLAAHLVLGALVGGVPPDPTVIAFLPEWSLGPGATIGGPYSVEQLATSFERGMDVWVLCAVAGLLWQACAGSTWCDLARAAFGRGSHLLVPGIMLGESLLVARPPRPDLAAVLEENRELCEAWRCHSRPSRPDARQALVASALLLMVTGLLYWAALAGGLRVRTSADTVHIIDARALAVAVFVLWCTARLVISRPRLLPRPRPVDLLALLGCIAVGVGVEAAPAAGTASTTTDPGRWPDLPVEVAASLAVALVVWVVAEGASTRTGT